MESSAQQSAEPKMAMAAGGSSSDVGCRTTITPPKATMFVWAKIPEQYGDMGSVEFSKMLIREAKVAVSPGIGFGEYGDDYVRFALVENPHRIKQAIKGVKQVL